MDHLSFTAALTQAETMARSTLDPALHERLSCAVALVKDGRVFQTSAGDWQVDSVKHPGQVYTVNGSCPCADSHYNKPPQGLCKHRLAMFLSQRVLTLMAQPPAPVVPDLGELTFPDNDHEETPDMGNPITPMPTPAPLPEAPASATVRLTIAGHPDVLFTLRDTDEGRLLARLQTLLAQFPVEAQPQPQGSNQLSPQQLNAMAMHRPITQTGWCAVHDTEMRWNEGRDGKRGWFSHKTSEGWCKGRK